MNAYELADELQKMFVGEEYDRLIHEIPDVLRQQANRIAELEKFNKAILKKGGYPYEKSNPVAWMSPDGKVSTTEGILFHIPLYTTSQTKPLSDEEIMQISHQALENSALTPKNNFMIAFARAIEERHGIK